METQKKQKTIIVNVFQEDDEKSQVVAETEKTAVTDEPEEADGE